MRKREGTCGLLAIAAVAIYMLACGSRPAWSPDSKRVVFGFLDPKAEASGLALYDLESQEIKRIYQTAGEVLFQPVWLGEQEQVLALAGRGEDALDIIQVNLADGESQVLQSISAKTAVAALLVPPILLDDRYLFFTGQAGEGEGSSQHLQRFDLQTGELFVVAGGLDHYLYQIGQGYFYLGGGADRLELGKFDTKKLEFTKLFVLADEEKYGAIRPALAGKKDGSEFALISHREMEVAGQETVENKLIVLLVNRKGKLLKEIPVPGEPGNTKVAHMVYGPEEKSLWVPVVSSAEPKEGQEVQQYRQSLLEVDIKRGEIRPVVQTNTEAKDEFSMQPSVSPNGKWLAVEVLMSKEQSGSVLYLVDLTDPERKVSEVSLPSEQGKGVLPAEE